MNATLDYIKTPQDAVGTSSSEYVYWCREFNCHHPMWDEEHNKHILTTKALEDTVLYHTISGWVSIAFRQDPLHSDDDITLYIWHDHQLISTRSTIIYAYHDPVLILQFLSLWSKGVECDRR